MHSFKLDNLKARDQFVKFGVEERIILKWIKTAWEGLDCTNVAQDRGNLAVIDTAMHLRFPLMS